MRPPRPLALVVAVLFALGGCLGGVPAASERTDAPSRTATTTGPSPAVPSIPNGSVAVADGVVRVEQRIHDPEIRYFPGNDTIRYVAAWRHVESGDANATTTEGPPEREAVYEYVPFEEWADNECVFVAARGVGAVVDGRLGGTPDLGYGVSATDGRLVVTILRTTTLDRDGDVVDASNVSYARVKAVAPERANATLAIRNRSYACTVPVRTDNRTVRYT